MARNSNRTDEEVKHGRPSEIAAMLGVHDSSIAAWSRNATFPKKNKNRQYCIRAVMQWYFANKADANVQRVMVEQLANRLGLRLADATGVAITGENGSQADSGVVNGGFKSPVDLLEYKMKLAKFERDLSDVVRIRHVAPVLASCFKKIREMLESVSRRTGIPLGESMERISSETIKDLNNLVDGGSSDHGE